MKEKIEFRTFPIEFRADESGPKIIGYSAVFNQLSSDFGGWKEKIAPGAFSQSIVEDDILALFNHDENLVLGRNTAGTLNLEEDGHGLKIEIIPSEAQFDKDMVIKIKRGDIKQMSFGFIVRKDEWDQTDQENIVRTLLNVQLWDVSPVTYPRYKQTSVSVASAREVFEEFQTSQKQELEIVENNRKKDVLAQERKAQIRSIKLDLIKKEVF